MTSTLRGAQAAQILSTDEADASLSPTARRTGILLALLGAALFSLKGVMVKLAYLPGGGMEVGELSPITVLFLRFGFSAPIYLAILLYSLRKGPLNKASAAQAFGLGLLGYHLCAWLDFAGLLYVTAQLERLILFTYPAFVVLLGGLFFGNKIRAAGLAAIAFAYLGILVVFLGGDIATGANVPLGSALVLGAAILFALFQLMAKPRIDALGSVRFTCLAMLGATSGVMTHYLIQTYGLEAGNPPGTLPGRIIALGAALAFLGTILPSFFVNLALGRIGPQTVAVLAMIGPLVTIIAAVIVLDEPFSRMDALGTLITFSGIALYTWTENRAKARQRKTHPTAVTR